MKRKFYQYDTKFYIDLSLVAYVQLNSSCVVVRDKNYIDLWNKDFKTLGQAKAYALELVNLMEQQENEN